MASRGRLIELLRRVLSMDSDEPMQGVAEARAAEPARLGRNIVPAQAGDEYALDALVRAVKPCILNGLEVKATSPPSDWVDVAPGGAYAEGHVYSVDVMKKIRVPIIGQPDRQIWWVTLGKNGLQIKATRDRSRETVLAKIVAPDTDCQKIRDNRAENINTHDAWIISGRDILLATGLEIDDLTEEEIMEVVRKIRADAIFGNIKLSDTLTIESTDRTIRLSDALRIFDTEENRLCQLSSEGLFFWDAVGRALARFTGAEGASMIAGLDVSSSALRITEGTEIQTEDGSALVDDQTSGLTLGQGAVLNITAAGRIIPTHETHFVTYNIGVGILTFIDPVNCRDGQRLVVQAYDRKVRCGSNIPAGPPEKGYIKIAGMTAGSAYTPSNYIDEGEQVVLMYDEDTGYWIPLAKPNGWDWVGAMEAVTVWQYNGDGTDDRIITPHDMRYQYGPGGAIKAPFEPNFVIIVSRQSYDGNDAGFRAAIGMADMNAGANRGIWVLYDDGARLSVATYGDAACTNRWQGVLPGTTAGFKLGADGSIATGTNLNGATYIFLAMRFGDYAI